MIILNVAICEDSITDAYMLKNLVNEFFKHNVDITIIEGAKRFYECNVDNFDVIIMDIMLEEGISGIDVVQQSIVNSCSSTVIFISSNPEFFQDVYYVDHIHFITKPVNKQRFFFALEKAVKIHSKNYITLFSNGTFKKLDLQQIIYLEASRHNTILYYENDCTEKISISITSLSKELEKYNFIRCHRSFCVNMHHISEYTSSKIFTDNGNDIPIGRNYQTTTLNNLLQFWGNNL